ncbi:UTP--glucose-1-phosphate uridylyltransferase (plasmid) [Sulfitobacter indolifex]|uniref:UTP--glucose-1-phosphate uridylyltransferase GalU n=1 Tax=Sulfitobacter indolifex TaxID=225422 RepID=UPI001FAE1B3D|nr:UTP--glucose-1-phosphate uridylyltransferase GalU [Sulfitobacter indolifex]UOA20700.1 UTP--glucose-1-phosphate uridylyltransferase [Sulfitobacter indolifex]
MPAIRKAVFPVAGLGTRFLPATKAMPKELLPIIDKPIIQYAVEEAIDAGIETLIFVTGRNKRAIEDHFDANLELEWALLEKGKQEARDMIRNIVPSRVECLFVRQPEQLGLGHAVLCARRAVGDEPFAVLLADDLMHQDSGTPTGDLIEAYSRTGKSALCVAEVAASEVNKYGIVSPRSALSDNTWDVAGLVEKPTQEAAPSQLASFGRYVFAPEVFDILEKTQPGAGNEIQLADAIDVLAARGDVVANRLKGIRYDCGDKLGYVKAVVHAALRSDPIGSELDMFLREFGYQRSEAA